jgi:lipopolysaccharide export system protein LptA
MQKKSFKNISIKILKILLWIIGSVIGLFLLLVIALQIPAVQNFAKDKAVTFLENKIKTKVEIGKITIGLPKKIILEDVYFEDQQQDTLLYGKKIKVDISLFKLLDNQLEINLIKLEGIHSKISKNSDGKFNFDYIIAAFESKEPPLEDAKPMQISLSKIMLDDIYFSYDDAISKNDFSLKLKHFDTKIKTFDLEQMLFDVPTINLDGLQLQLNQGIAEASAKSATKIKEEVQKNPIKISNKILNLANIDVIYKDETSKLNTKIQFKELTIAFEKIDLINQKIKIKELFLSETDGKIALGKIEKQAIENQKSETTSTFPWEITLDKITLNKINFSFDDANAKKTVDGIDYAHLDLSNLNLNAIDLNYSARSTSGKINAFSVSEKSGLVVEQLQTNFYYSEKNGAFLKNLYLKTPNSEIKDHLVVKYKNRNSIAENLAQLEVNLQLINSKIAVRDVLLFAPQLANIQPFNTNKNEIIFIDGKLYGQLHKLTIPSFKFSGIGNSSASISGKINGLPDVETAYFDLDLQSIETTAADIATFVPKDVIPTTIELPSQMKLEGTFQGKLSNFKTDLLATTSMGNATVKGNFNQTEKNKETYSAETLLDEFDLGAFLKNEKIGKLSIKATIQGVGLDPKTANATIESEITKAEFNQYVYQNIKINGTIADGNYDATIDSKDENLQFNLLANGGWTGATPSLKLNLKLAIADLRKLNLHAGYLKLKGNVDADFDSLNLDNLNGKVSITNTLVVLETEQFPLDTIQLTATSTSEKNTIKFQSQFANANIEGQYKLTSLPEAVQNTISKYYAINKPITSVNEPQQLRFSLLVKDDPLFQKLVPELKNLSAITVEGNYNSVNDTIQLNATIPKLNYNDNVISNAVLKVDTKEGALTYNLVVDDLKNNSFQLPHVAVFGKIENNTIDYDVQLKDSKNVERYLFAGTLKKAAGATEVVIKNEKLVLNYEKWNINDNNLVSIEATGIIIRDFILTNGNNKLAVNSENAEPNSPIVATFEDFELNSITSIVESDFDLTGKINGNTKISNLSTSPVFIADLNIENFSIKQDTVGNINIQVDNQTANVYDAKVQISGFNNSVLIDGKYFAVTELFDLQLNIDQFQMKSIQGFTFGNLTKSTGFLNGTLNINGKVNQPIVNGFIKFNEVGFEVKTLRTNFQLLNDKINFANQKVLFSDFKLQDENNNNLTLNGNIELKDLSNMGLNLSLVANNFNPINSTEKDNELFYGKLFLDNDLYIKGTIKNPIVNGSIKINKDTDFSVVLPQTKPSIVDREGIVEFVDQDQPILYDTTKQEEQLNQSQLLGIEASVNIEVDKDAAISIIIDKVNGDYLKLKGEAELTGGIDASGKTSLTGKYEFTGGSYEMSFNLIKRKFDIKPGSYILWKGEPLLADVNITAIYKTDAAPIDLVADQLGNVSPDVRNTYKEKIPFETELKMNGELLKPEISFDIVMPKLTNSVSAEVINTTKAKLEQIRQQKDIMNKQVFALLILNRFLGENPFESEAGGTSASTLARQSASKLLSEQLNNLAADLISGVKIDFDLQSTEDYSSGTKENKTDLSVGFSKNLFNDRLTISVGSSIGIEGTPRENEQANTIAGDIEADYMLTKDGRYKVRAYQKNDYQVALQGQVIETGVAFIITMDYNKFKELFQSTKKKEKKKNKSDEAL